MNRKEREVKVIAGIAFAAIMIALIFAMIAPITMAGTNGGFSPVEEPASSIRIYGGVQPQGKAPEQYITSKEPFDPTVIPTDSITYNPAIIEESREEGEPYYGVLVGKGVSSENAREKIFLRSWYEPCGRYNGPGENGTHPTINLEYTYMLMNTLYLPITGTAPNTEFLVPTCEIDTQTGLGAWSGANDTNLTSLASVSGPAVAPSGETVLGEISLEKRLALQEGDKVQFFDHTVELTNITISGEFVIKVAYVGNAQDDSEKGGVSLENGETIYFDRHNNEYTTANHDPAAGNIRTWYVSRDEDTLIVGKELHWSDVFYVDAVRYEVTAVEVVDTENGDGVVDAFKYITLRTKLPKGVGSVRDESVVSSQFIDCIEPAELIPLLPPFNMNHDMVDDIDIPLWTGASEERDWTKQDYAGTELDPDGDGNWIAYDVNERVIDNLDPLELTYIAGEVEERYSTDLLEKLREDWGVGGLITESWTNFDIQSLPDQYTEFVLPALPDYYTIPIDGDWPVELDGDYLITTSLIAPQATGDLYDNKRGTIPGDPSEQRVAFSYDPKDGEGGNDLYVYYDEEIRMGTLKIYGNGSDITFGITNSCNIEQYENWEEPFNPTAIRTASITFDSAILQYSSEYPMTAQNESVDLKEYLRVWYVPEYEFYGWHEMIGLAPAIVIETTYMLIDSQDKQPWHADVGSGFPFPIVSDPATYQIGLDSFGNPGVESIKENLVRLASLSCNPDDITEGLLPKTTNGTISIEKTYILEEGDEVQFLDHSLRFDGYDISDTLPMVYISYYGNSEPEDGVQNYLSNTSKYFDRHSFGTIKQHPDRTWYARYDGRLNATDKALITVGKELQRGDIFYVDGVRYEIPAIEVLDHDGNRQNGCEMFKYITLRTPLPKYLGDGEYSLGQHYLSCADSQWISKVETCYPQLALPVLPPMNMDHDIVDDTDVVLWQPLKLLDKWPYGDKETGKAGTEYFPCGERYLTMQYPPAAWLKFFRAVPIDTDGDMTTSIPSDWQLWSDYGGPFYPGDVTVAVPDGWQCCECGIPMPLPDGFTVFDREHWIANDVDERIIGPVDPLQFCWKEERPEPRYSTNLLEILHEDGLIETWTKFDIRTTPDEYTRFKMYEIPSLNPEVYVGGEYQVTFEPDIRFDPLSLARPGCCLITTSFFAPNAKGDLNREHSYSVRDRFAFTFNPAEGTGIYMNRNPVIPTKLTIESYTISNSTIIPPQTTAIDVAFSESVSYRIAIENATGTIYDWTGNAKNPQAKVWDGTYEADGAVVPVGDYTVNVTGTNTTTGKSVTDTSKVITVLGDEVYGVDLNVDISEQTVAPNVTATYTLTVKNTGNVADNYTLFLTNDNYATILYLNKCLIANLGAGASESILLNVGNTTEGTFVVDVMVTSEKGGAGVYDMITTTTTVQNVTLTIVSYTISNSTIIPPQTTEIDVAFSEWVSYKIAIENATGTIYDWTGNAKNPVPRVWDGTYEANGTVVPAGDYTVNVTGTNTTTGLSVVNNTEIITVTATTLSVGQGAPTEAIKNHFIDAYNRNGGITVLGNPTTAVHKAWGYWVQDFPGASGYAGGIIMYNPYKDYAYYIHGAIWDRYYTLGGPNAKTDIEFVLGPPISDIEPYVHTLPPEVSRHGTQFRYQNFEGGALDLNVDTGAVFEIHCAIFTKWSGLGYAAGDLGLVTSDEREATISAIGTTGRVSDFEDGHIHWHRNGANANTAFETHGAIDVVYCTEGGSGGWLGFPVSDEYVNPSGYAQSDFEGGYITTTDGVNYVAFGKEDYTVGQDAPTEAIKNHFIAAYNRNGGLPVLDNPTTAVHRAWGYWVQDFPGASGYAGGIIMYNPYKNYAYYIHGAIWDRYFTLGGPRAETDIKFELGPPISDIEPYVHTLPPEVSSHGTQFRYQNFEGGALDHNVDTGTVFEIHGTIFAKWKGLGYAAGDLGLVTSDEREAAISAIGTEGRVSDFEGGHIHWHRNGALANTAFETHGAIDVVYCSEGGSGGWLGFPVSDEYVNPSGYAQSDFEGGYITTRDGVNYEAFGKEDTTPPTLTIVHPIYLHDKMIDLTGTAYDVNGILNNEVLIMVDSEEFDVCRHFFAPYNSITGWWRLTDIPIGYGNNVITVYAQDTNHNVAEETTSVYLAHPDFSFVHLTDAHITDDYGWFPLGEGSVRYPLSRAKFNSDIHEINHIDPKPDFILDTGDVAHVGGKKYCYDWYIQSLESLDSSIDVYVVPGNHDRYTRCVGFGDDLTNFKTIINRERPARCKDIIPPNNYIFEHKGYLLIGLDSGRDYIFDILLPPEANGLSEEQISVLKNKSKIDPTAPKIIFMHHPAINHGNNGCIINNRPDFIEYCNDNSVQLVLTGHTHEAHVFCGTGEELVYKPSGDSYQGPLFIQTQSATKDEGKFKHGYRIIDIKDGKAFPHQHNITKTPPMISGSAACPVTLHAYDSQGRHIGINLTGESERNIPDSFYFSGYEIEANETLNITANQTIPETIFLYNTSDDYQFEILANLTEEMHENESFNFTVEQQTDDTRTIITYHNVPLTENTTATLPINLTTTAYTMEIDHNGDGTTDETKDPDFIETNYAPAAAIIAPETGAIYNESDPVMFNGTGRDPEDGILTNFSLVWYSNINGVIGCGERFNTANLSAGAHTITLMVNDSVDLRDTDSVMITVVGSTLIPPIANFTYTPENPVVTQQITFNASNSTDPDGIIKEYEWDFGDGNVTNTTEPIITHTYASAGDYTVNLTVTDDSGATNSTSHLINIISPIGGFSVAILPKINSANAGEACDFTVRLRNTQNFVEYVDLDLTLSGIPAEYAANLAWFNWTTSALSIPEGEYRDIGLRMDIPEGISGYKSFGVIAHGTFGDSKDYGVANVTLAP